MLTLYHWEPNANSGKPIMALKEKGVPFESHWIDLQKFDHHQPDYLAINPMGTIPAMVHDGLMLFESTAIMEYVDDAFEGPPLRPADPGDEWRMRWWMKFIDQWYAPAASMIGWASGGVRSSLSQSDEELEEHLKAIPLKERQRSWAKTIHGAFSDAELAESRRRGAYGAALMEEALRRNRWMAGETYSLADINAFNLVYFMPARDDSAVNDRDTPYTMEWLRKIYERPAAVATWDMGRMMRPERLRHLARYPDTPPPPPGR